jgi:hypothetical protein
MSDRNNANPREVYQSRMAARQAEAAQCQRQHVLLGYARLALVLAGIVVAWCSFLQHLISRWWLLGIVAVFVFVARRHSAVLQQKAEALRAIAFFERGIARIDDRWAELPARSAEVNATGSLFADDLDLFRQSGLFELLNTARTSPGDDALAAWLLEPAQRDLILARQEAVAELRDKTELREQLGACGEADFERLDIASLARWAADSKPQISVLWRWISPLFVALTIAAAILYLATNHGWLLLVMVIIDATITHLLLRKAQSLFLGTERASGSLKLASVLIWLWEQQEFSSPLLHELRHTFQLKNGGASKALARLAQLANLMEQRGNLMVRILDAPLLYSVQLACAAQAWKSRYGSSMEHWLRTLGDLEALESLATYSFEHPNDPFPALADGEACFEATALGHPLIPEAKCVRNDVSLGKETDLLLVSGSNMSGKSTLLRAVGINAVLAMAGAPVRAGKLRMTPLHVGASIQVNDSLQEGRSRFYSEILRLRSICALAEVQPPVLFLLDELLDGTNSSDRLTGAEGIAHALLAAGAIGLISTHDLALTSIGDGANALRNVHFEERVENGEMHFDFRLRDGVVTTRNGVALMRMVGLKV